MPSIRLTGSVRSVCDKLIIIELDEESKNKLQTVMDGLPETTNVRTIHCSGSFAFKVNDRTKFTGLHTPRMLDMKWDDLSDIVGYRVDITASYRYYKFVSDGITTDGYTFTACIVRL